MANNTTIKWYFYTNTDAPALENAFGSMIRVLDGCLIDGFGSQQAQALNYDSNNICTITFLAAHNFRQYQVIEISGNAVSEFNGQFRILTVPSSTSLTIQLNTTPAASSSGTTTVKLPPLGWSKPYSSSSADGSRAAYRSNNTLLPSRPYLRVVDEKDPLYTDTWCKYAKVGIVEEMSAINNMSGVQSPYDSATPDRNWVATGTANTANSVQNGWACWYYARPNSAQVSGGDAVSPGNGNRPWILVGTTDYFYILTYQTTVFSTGTCGILYGFGQYLAYSSTDVANNFLLATTRVSTWVASTGFYLGQYSSTGQTMAPNCMTMTQRPYAGTANPGTSFINILSPGSGVSIHSGLSNLIAAPASINGMVGLFTTYIGDTSTTPYLLRGELYNLYGLLQSMPYDTGAVFIKDGSAYMAWYTPASSSIGQWVVKIGDLT